MVPALVASAEAPRVEIIGTWQVRVGDVTLEIAPATLLKVRDEKHDALPVYNPSTAAFGMSV